MTWLWFILGSLATFRLSLMVSKEDGPAWIFYKLRKAVPSKSSAKEGIQCLWCTAVWMSAIVCALFAWNGMKLKAPMWIIVWLAQSAAAICWNQAFTKGKP